MAELNENHRVFRCNYTDAPLYDRISVWGLCIGVAVALVLSVSNITLVAIFTLLYMLIPLWFEFGIYMVRTRSSLELTDGEIIVRRWLRRHQSFPIDKVESIHIVDTKNLTDKRIKDYRLPISMGRVNLYPTEGVLVFFDRKWIKSVQPILFNPADLNQFAKALSDKSGRPVSE